jgi:hypothetical protein
MRLSPLSSRVVLIPYLMLLETQRQEIGEAIKRKQQEIDNLTNINVLQP